MAQRGVSYYVCYGLLWTAGIILAGAVAGAALYPLMEWALPVKGTVWEMARKGMADGAFYGLVWAPGAGIVMAVRRAYLDRHPEGAIE